MMTLIQLVDKLNQIIIDEGPQAEDYLMELASDPEGNNFRVLDFTHIDDETPNIVTLWPGRSMEE